MVDETRVLRLLRRLSDETDVLEAEADASVERRSDPLWLRGVKYSFVVVIEVAVDVAQHTCAAEGWGPPDDNGHAMRLLGQRGVLDASLAVRMSRAVGFRNLLVHEYAAVDDNLVVERLADLHDLRSFVRSVGAWLLAARST